MMIPKGESAQELGGQALLSRRDFTKLAGLGVGTMLLGFWVSPGRAAATSAGVGHLLPAYIEITPDNVVHLVTPAAEMGQGVQSSLPAILAEELEADWRQVAVRLSGAGEAYINPGKNMQATGRSLSVRGYFDLLRRVGATARTMLCQAAADEWGVPVSVCTARDSHITNTRTGARLRFADVAGRAAELPVPETIKLKARADYTLIGRDFDRKDIPEKITGRAIYGIDVEVPGMLVATVAAPPAFGGALTGFDEAAAKAVPGVVAAIAISDGLAVVAETYWQAKLGLEAAAPAFDPGPNGGESSATISDYLTKGLDESGVLAIETGSTAALAGAAKRIGGDYSVPYLAHTTMEPMTCTADVRADACELWVPTQGPIRVRDAVAKQLGLAPEQVTVNRTYLGGGFGRRWQIDFVTQTVEIARRVGKPVKLIWSREEDVQHDFYRPAFAMRFAAGLDKKGKLESLQLRVSGASIGEWGRAPRPGVLDALSASGLKDSHYRVPNYRVEWVSRPGFVPIGTWRSVGHSQNGFFLEGVIDEAAHAAGADPLAFRRQLLGNDPRWGKVLDRVAKMSGWGKRPAKGRARGIAIAESYGSLVAEVIELSVDAESQIKIHQISAVIDCGFAVQPGGVVRQMESAIIYALGAAMTGKITLADGAVEQSNFHDYPALFLAETPPIAVEVLTNDHPLGGAGEPGVPPLAPALTNALFAATGKRIRSLPLSDHGFELV